MNNCPDTKEDTEHELAMLVRMLVSALKKSDPENDLCTRALKYLGSKNLLGNILRKN